MKRFSFTELVIVAACPCGLLKSQNKMNAIHQLDEKQKNIVAISALTASGDIEKLEIELNKGLKPD